MNGEVKFLTPLGREFQTREERVSEIVEELRSIHLAREEERERAILAERQAREAEMRAEEERNRAELATRQAQAAAAREKEAIRRAEQLAAKLRELGVNPDDLPSANS
jgi:chromosome segregation ATPase